MSLKNRSYLIALFLAPAPFLSSCASFMNIKEEIYLQSLNIEMIQDKEFYIEALTRWPDLTASQLQRRAFILSAHPKKSDLRKLDATRDEETEFEILKKLDLKTLVSRY